MTVRAGLAVFGSGRPIGTTTTGDGTPDAKTTFFLLSRVLRRRARGAPQPDGTPTCAVRASSSGSSREISRASTTPPRRASTSCWACPMRTPTARAPSCGRSSSTPRASFLPLLLPPTILPRHRRRGRRARRRRRRRRRVDGAAASRRRASQPAERGHARRAQRRRRRRGRPRATRDVGGEASDRSLRVSRALCAAGGADRGGGLRRPRRCRRGVAPPPRGGGAGAAAARRVGACVWSELARGCDVAVELGRRVAPLGRRGRSSTIT